MQVVESKVDGEHRGAILSDCLNYRYSLWRIWGNGKKVNFIGLNPSTADGREDDRTISRLRNFAKSWGYDGFYITNLFAYRTKKPSILKKAKDPIGVSNDQYILGQSTKCSDVVFMWGTNGSFMNRNKQVEGMISVPKCIAITKGGHPSHPLYLKGDLTLMLYPRVKFIPGKGITISVRGTLDELHKTITHETN